jgi:transposase
MGETGERRLNHSDGEAERFYRDLQRRQVKVRVGIEATGHARWFERLLAELKFELWIGDPAKIKAARVRKQKTDRQDAQLLLRLLVESRFPRIWVPTPENRDLRQLIWHRHRLVQMRTRAMNQIQAAAMNEGVRRKKTLWSKTGRRQLEALLLAPWATRRRQDLLELVDRLNTTIDELTAAAEQEARKRPEVLRLMTHPGVGPITALALCAGAWISGSLRLRPLQRRSSTTGAHHQTRKFSVALSTGGGSPGCRPLEPRLATSLRSSGHASRPSHR